MAHPEKPHPIISVHYDADGTLVRKVKGIANARKYPTPIAEGILEFLDGFHMATAAKIGNIITKRSKVRRRNTERTLAETGLGAYVDTSLTRYSARILSSGAGKVAMFLGEVDVPDEAPETIHSMLEDNPLDLIPEALCVLSKTGVRNTQLLRLPKLAIGIVGAGAVQQALSTQNALDALGLLRENEVVESENTSARLEVAHFTDQRDDPCLPMVRLITIPTLDGSHGRLYGEYLASMSHDIAGLRT